MIFSYRTRRALGRLLTAVLVLAAFAVAVLLCWLLWLQKFVVYTPQGVRFDFGLSQTLPVGVEAKPVAPSATIAIQYGQGPEEDQDQPAEPQRLTGYYVTVEELLEDLEGVLQKIITLPEDTAVLVDVKGTWGYFYYPTQVGATTSGSFDMTLMQRFFETVNSQGLYTIARLPAFRDYDYAAKNTHCGLPVKEGYLWADESNCYWLDPTDDQVLTYLIDICKELQGMGFDEVVFKDFCLPDTDQIVFSQDPAQALAKAAKTLVTACASKSFTVSFLGSHIPFAIPQSGCRLYLQDVAATEVSDTLARYPVTDVQTQVVFLAPTGDTRYDVAGALRPLAMALT